MSEYRFVSIDEIDYIMSLDECDPEYIKLLNEYKEPILKIDLDFLKEEEN